MSIYQLYLDCEYISHPKLILILLYNIKKTETGVANDAESDLLSFIVLRS